MYVDWRIYMKKQGIRKQILKLVTICSLITLFVVGGISLSGMIKIKSDTAKIGTDIGITAAEMSSEILEKEMLNSLQTLVSERSRIIEYLVDDLCRCVTALSQQMTEILQHPQDYKSKRLYLPSELNDYENKGKILPVLRYMPGVNSDDVAEEVALASNLQSLQRTFVSLIDKYESFSAHLTSESGFSVIVTENGHFGNSPFAPSDFRESSWYKRAIQENKVILSDLHFDFDVDDTQLDMLVTAAAPYYNSKGEIAGVVGIDSTAREVTNLINSTKIGENGYSFILNNKTGQVLFSAKSNEGTLAVNYNTKLEEAPVIFDNENEQLANAARKMEARETGISLVNVDGTFYYLAYNPISGVDWSLGSLIEEAIVKAPVETSENSITDSTNHFVYILNSTIVWIIIAMIISFVVIIVVLPIIARKFADKLVKPLQELNEGVKEIATGNLDKKLDIHTDNEIEDLSVCFNLMTDELKSYIADLEEITAERESINTELYIATGIQLSMLPRNFNIGHKDVEIYATLEPAREVGGDFYDFYMKDERHLVITIADVSGKGISAALFMVESKAILHDLAMISNKASISKIMSYANNNLYIHNKEMMFVTVFMAMIDLETGKMIYVNAGHNPPLIYKHKKDQKFHYLDVKSNFVLGMLKDIKFVQQETQLERGDIIYLYTDGITEAMNGDSEQYNEQRLEECLNSVNKSIELKKLLAAVKMSVLEYVGGTEQSDDMTMLAVRVK